MVKDQSFWYRSMFLLIIISVCVSELAVYTELPIPLAVVRSLPYPAQSLVAVIFFNIKIRRLSIVMRMDVSDWLSLDNAKCTLSLCCNGG